MSILPSTSQFVSHNILLDFHSVEFDVCLKTWNVINGLFSIQFPITKSGYIRSTVPFNSVSIDALIIFQFIITLFVISFN